MFVGRAFEVEQLQRFYKRNISGLAVCCGRRRIGKSTLIEFTARNYRFIEFYGLAPHEASSKQQQLDHFARRLAKQFNISFIKFDDWQDALEMLATLTKQGQFIILLDEISWMAIKDKDFPGKLKGVWDTQLKHNPELKLVLCGSVSSWIQKNILRNKGFVGRVSLTINLDELPLYEANHFWDQQSFVSAKEKLKVLSVTGGVPRYLEEIDPTLSAEENLKRMCFTKGGVLVDEFDKIFSDLFNKQAKDYQDIVNVLLNNSKSHEEICQSLGVKPSGNLNNKLKVLTECGFLARDYVWRGNKYARKLSKFRLRDNYLRFYLKYMAEKKQLIETGMYQTVNLDNFNDWHSTLGLQFENLVLNNLPLIQKVLSISPESLLSASPYFQNHTKRQAGCQIDLLIQTKFTYYVCEIKFRQQLGQAVINDVLKKMHAIKVPDSVTIRPILIYAGNLSSKVASKNFFSKIINFEDLLEDRSD